jgi:ATP-dependent DNA helicase RecG
MLGSNCNLQKERYSPFVTINDFKPDLFDKARNLMRSYRSNHPWLQLSNEELLLKAGLWKRDIKTNEEGYTLAAILLFGKDEIIRSAMPAYKIDLIVRKENIDRYDDRDTIKTNLIDAFDRIMLFIEKHLPDKFYMEDTQRVSLRSKNF